MKNKYMITIDGINKTDGESNHISFSTEGSYECGGDLHKITYIDSALTGYDGDITSLSVEGSSSVLLERTGKTSSRLFVKSGERSMSFYDVGFGCLSLGVGNAKIENRLGEKGGTLKFRYMLDVDANVLSENEITVTVREKA